MNIKELKENCAGCGGLLVLSGGALWGLSGTLITIMSGFGSSPGLTSFLRMAFSFIIFLSYILIKHGRAVLKISREQLFYCAMLGLICQGMYNFFYCNAVTVVGVSTAVVLLYIAPLFTALFSFFIFKESFTITKIIALAINVVGCFFAATGGKVGTLFSSGIGILFGLLAGLSYSLTPIIGKLASKEGNFMALNLYSYLFAVIFLGIFARPWRMLGNADYRVYLVGLLYALIPTMLGYLLYYKGVQKIKESSNVPVLASIEMLVASAMGFFVFHESLSFLGVVGLLLMLCSIFLMSKKSPIKLSSPKNKRRAGKNLRYDMVKEEPLNY